MEYLGLKHIKGSLVTVEGVQNPPPKYDEIVEIKINANKRLGRVLSVAGDRAVILVFEGTSGMSLTNTATKFTGRLLDMPLSTELLGRTFDGGGRPIDGLGQVFSNQRRQIFGTPINPVKRVCPRNYIHTGISAIDALVTLVRGQKLPIFSVDGLPHNQLAAQISGSANAGNDNFAVVFGAMGVSHDTAEFFRNFFKESGVVDRTIMYINHAFDPPGERLTTPRFALTAAEYLAFDLDYHVLVILTDMTQYAEAVREISSSNGEIPSRKGYPGYLYSDFASIYERAGIVKGSSGSLTQIPILTMPNGDISHPIPDLTGYITEGQIVFDQTLHQKGIYPPINVLSSLSRLMKNGVKHPKLAAQLLSKYAKVADVRAMAQIIGEEDLSKNEKNLLDFGRRFEGQFLNQQVYRSLDETVKIGLELLC